MKQKTNHTKIGARCLTEAEAKMILPTYDEIYSQIEQFRLEKEDTTINLNQKTNNIGIIGVRGAGKTSLLKTIRAKLEKENQAKDVPDLIFPIIVPENMSESSTLMSTVLGMLKEFVDAQVRKEETEQRNDYCTRESSCKKSYDEVIKQYTYIQKEYRDIMIQEYTTEVDYVKSSTKIFNSDVEFQKKFNDLIRMLVQGSDNAMLVLFIDDIDLSTHRCTDVVKTLLSYLSNENIITFISGDLETFEEALTLDFLRQEGVLEKNTMEESMLAGVHAASVLESKKKLSYEYLKKILPPAYRHNIKMWDLEEKENYCIINAEDNSLSRPFSKCLTEALQGWVDPAFFQYIDTCYEKETAKALPYTYHLFDNTSRGLNNVYNVLNDIIGKRKQKKDEQYGFIVEKKQLLDTIISSTQIYNQYRQQIQEKILFIGEGRNEVSFENALAVIYPETKEEKDYPIQKPVERFALFIFTDFAARILYESEYGKRTAEDSNYQKLKKNAMKDLLRYPEIAGKVRTIEIDPNIWEKESSKTNNASNDNKNVYNNHLSLSDLSTGFLTKGDLLLNLAFYKGLSLDLVQMLYPVSNKAAHTAEQKQQVFLAFEKAVHSIARINGIESAELLAEGYYAVFWQEFRFIQNSLSNISKQNETLRLFSEECADINFEKYSFLRRIVLNTIAEIIPEQESNRNLDHEVKNMETIRKIIQIINHRNLWQELPAEHVIRYLKHTIANSIDEVIALIPNDSENTTNKSEKITIDLTNAIDSWNKFYQSYDGVTFTKAAETKQHILNLLKQDVFKSNTGSYYSPTEIIEYVKKKGIDSKTFDNILQAVGTLAGNYRVWYGRVEAQELENGMMTSFLKMDELKKNYPKYNDFAFCLHYYYNYKIATGDEEQIQHQAKLLEELSKIISSAHQTADKKVLDSFIDQLNEDLNDAEKITDKKFKELFDAKK